MGLSEIWMFHAGAATVVAPRTFFVPAFANVVAFETDEGIVLVDTGSRVIGESIREAVRAESKAPLHTVVFTHGHFDHAFGLQPWLDEEPGRQPRIVAHEAVIERFERYQRMREQTERINGVQFGIPLQTPTDFFRPSVVYRDALTLEVGGETFELRHGRGETDDATWVWAPSRGVVCAGDFWISCVPNCGNPQKVQRYAEDWAGVLEAMAKLQPEILLPGHGPPIQGAAAVQEALTDVARYLRSLVEQTIAALNAGMRHDEIVAKVKPPADLVTKPYLQPLYDRPEFIVRNVIRLYAGWWDGYAANLLPAPAVERAREIVKLAGGVEHLVRRARELEAQDLPLACHLAEWAALAAPDDRGAQEAARDLFRRRAEGESSLMGRGIFSNAVRSADAALAALK